MISQLVLCESSFDYSVHCGLCYHELTVHCIKVKTALIKRGGLVIYSIILKTLTIFFSFQTKGQRTWVNHNVIT